MAGINRPDDPKSKIAGSAMGIIVFIILVPISLIAGGAMRLDMGAIMTVLGVVALFFIIGTIWNATKNSDK